MRTFVNYFLVVFSIIFSNSIFAQDNVGIGTTTPDPSSILELSTVNKGFLAPRLTTIQRTSIATPATGLLVYDTDFSEFWYFDGIIWRSLAANNQWNLTGNIGTNPNINFIGTTDVQPFLVKTGGALAGNERIRVLANGQVCVNKPVPFTRDVFSVYGTGTVGAINPLGIYSICGYSADSLGVGIYGENTSNGNGVFGKSYHMGQGVFGLNDSAGDGVWGQNSGNGAGVRGQATNNGTGVVGTNDANGYGVFGYTIGSGMGVAGINADSLAGAGHGVYGQASYELSFGVYGHNVDSLGTGVMGIGNNSTGSFLAKGSGGAFVGKNIGVYGKSAATFNNDTTAGGYFISGTSYAYVGAFDGVLNRKVVGNGTVNTIVNDVNNKPVLFSAPEAPENLFNDYGTGQLINGKASITLDPTFSKNIAVNDKHPLRVFVQLEGDCKGVYVTNKTKNGFDVVELDGGHSNIKFTWTVCANRADEIAKNGFVLKYSDERFGNAPKPLQEDKFKPVEIKSLNGRSIIKTKKIR